ncbi:MAG: GMC oxidoreductase, partial [Kangiellaceae bacterium]|nr:GMC oxidoreductase [Kangiellaceae bacterium]
GVGENLQEHADVVISTKSKVSDTVALNFSGVFKMAYEFYRHVTKQAGLFSKPIVESGGFIFSNPDKEIPDIQLQSTCSLFNDHGLDHKVIREHGYSLHITLLRPKSRGTVKLRSGCYSEEPLIHLNLLDHQDDVKDLTNGFKLGRNILRQDAYQRHRGKELFPGEHIQTDEEIEQMLRERVCHIYHPVGTCKMGSDDMAVVDDQLRVHGVNNLRVIDASIMPTITSGNTNAPTMAIASKGAELILEHYQS